MPTKISILTGASQSIGYELSKRLLAKGNKVLRTIWHKKKQENKLVAIRRIKNNTHKKTIPSNNFKTRIKRTL
jgi:short-subunit dehydrogenase